MNTQHNLAMTHINNIVVDILAMHCEPNETHHLCMVE